MNSKSKALSSAWEAMEESDRQQWFRNNTRPELDELPEAQASHVKSTTSSVNNGVQVVNQAIPYTEYEETASMKGWSAEKIQLEWNKCWLTLLSRRSNMVAKSWSASSEA